MSQHTYRFKPVALRAFNPTTKKMYYSSETSAAFIVLANGFSVAEIDADNNLAGLLASDDDGAVLMQGTNYKDDKGTYLYEGDVVFMRVPMKKGLLPVLGIVNAKDFTFTVNAASLHHPLQHANKNVEVLGNIFENTDEELAAKSEVLLQKYEVKK